MPETLLTRGMRKKRGTLLTREGNLDVRKIQDNLKKRAKPNRPDLTAPFRERKRRFTSGGIRG